MIYPPPGEVIVETLRNVEFGMGRPRDEPAPPDIAAYFRALQAAWDELGAAQQEWSTDRCDATYISRRRAELCHERIYNHLLKTLRKHRDRCYTCDGRRIWLHTEPHGCRREVVRIEEV